MNKCLKNIILFVVGFCIYITIEVLFRGYSYPVMGVCAGIAILILDKINDKISWDTDLLLQGLIGSLIVTFMELVIGLICIHNNIAAMWDYTNIPFNYKGIICLPFSLIWIILSIVGVFIADAINYYVFEELPVPYYKIFGRVVIRFNEKHCKL